MENNTNYDFLSTYQVAGTLQGFLGTLLLTQQSSSQVRKLETERDDVTT